MDEAQVLTTIWPGSRDFKSFSEEVQSLIEAIADEYGLSVKISPYDSKIHNTCNAQITFAVKQDAHGNVVDPELTAFTRAKWSHGIEDKHFRAVFRDSNSYQLMRVTGYISRSRKYTIAVETERGKKYKMSAAHVRSCLEDGAWTDFDRITVID